MKKIISLLILLTLHVSRFTLTAHGQLQSTTNHSVAGGTTLTNSGLRVALGTGDKIAVQFFSTSTAANTSNVIVYVDQSNQTSNWVSTGVTMTLPATGTNTAICVSNLVSGAVRYWRFNVENGAPADITNTVKFILNIKGGI